MARRSTLRQSVLALAASLALAGCEQPPSPTADLPPGALLLARRPALQEMLDAAAQLEGTPLARMARALAQRLPSCEWIEAQAPEPAGLGDALACGDPGGPLAALHRSGGEHDLALVLPVGEEHRLVARADVAADGGLAVSLELPGDALAGAAAFLLPGREPAGPALLAAKDPLVHARVRAAERLDLASLVSSEGQASRLFQLKSALFSGLVLDDTWEVAVYPPEAGQRTPRAAFALGVREREAAVAAIEDFVANVRAHWSVERSAFAVGAARGACLLDLKLLPDLAPCYVATPRALVIGWNPASLRKALEAGTADAAAGFGGPGALVLDFARVQEADAQLRALAPPGSQLLPAQTYPWRRLTLEGAREGAAVRLRLALAGRESA